MTFQANIFDDLLHFQTEYFRWNTNFSKVLFSAAQGVFILFHLSKQPDFEINGSYCTIVSWTTWVYLILLQ
jgi:hypothetical protein